jgi:hypothetical protein
MMPAMADDDAQLLRDADRRGTHYELRILIGPYGDDAALLTATEALVSAAGIEDLWDNVFSEPVRIERDAWPLELATITRGGGLVSVVDIPSVGRVHCGVSAFREEDVSYGPVRNDCLILYIPTAAFEHLDGYKAYERHEAEGLAWQRPIDDWLAQVAIEVSRTVSFKFALIGEEPWWAIDDFRPFLGGYGVVLPDGTYMPASWTPDPPRYDSD